MISEKSTDEELLSHVIDFLRFPLIVGVVFIHNYNSTMIVQGVEIGSTDAMPLYYIVSELFSQVIGRVAVPLFFFISGFLFFYKSNFTRDVYCQKLQKRMWTLLIPYLFWNIACLVFYYAASRLPVISSWFQGAEYNLDYLISALWGKMDEQSNMTYPIAYQFWFIRDLMICVLISPLMFKLVTKTKYYGILFLGVCWYLGYYLPYLGLRGFSTIAIFFFSFGAWFSINRKNVLSVFKKLKYWPFLYFPVAILDVFTKTENYNPYIHRIGILLGIMICFTWTARLLQEGRIHIVPFLSSASFFVFAVHDPWLLLQIRKVLFKLIQPDSDIVLTLLYFGIVILVIAIALGMYYLLRRYLPRFTALITGGR